MANRRDSCILLTIAVGITAGFYFLLFAPQQRKLSGLRASLEALEDQLDRQTLNLAELPEVEAQLQRINELLADYRTRIPETAEVGNFVEEVSAIAERLGLRHRNVVPLAPERYGAVTALPIRISFEARFPALFDFLREIESLPRVARVTGLVVERPQAEEQPVDYVEGEFTTELTMQVFYGAT